MSYDPSKSFETRTLQRFALIEPIVAPAPPPHGLLSPRHAENTRMAYSIMAGVPDERVHLDAYRSMAKTTFVGDEAFVQPECRSVGCIAGWLSAHEYFKAQGLRFVDDGVIITGRATSNPSYYLFGSDRIFYGLDFHVKGNHKRLALERLRAHLFENKCITPQRNKQLAQYERTL